MKTRSDKRLPFPLDERRVDVCLGHVHFKPGCWEWLGPRDRHGYGLYQQNGLPAWRAHRAVWTLLVGPIPDGLHLDHLCRNRGCVRPSHLEPVTPAENVRRAMRDQCAQGHPWDEANTGRRQPSNTRYCLTCNRERQAQLRAEGRDPYRVRKARVMAGKDVQMKHGTAGAYSLGCRCEPCRIVNNAYSREYRRRRAAKGAA